MDVEVRASKIKLIAFDVDGVLTNGQLFFDSKGEAFKVFHVLDGLGITAARKAGLKIAVITGRESEMVLRRCEDLRIEDICQAVTDKTKELVKLATKQGLVFAEICYVGDDLNDLPVIEKVGLACAVANAVPEVKSRAHYISEKSGGAGAVREIIEMVLKSQNKWDSIVDGYRRGGHMPARQ